MVTNHEVGSRNSLKNKCLQFRARGIVAENVETLIFRNARNNALIPTTFAPEVTLLTTSREGLSAEVAWDILENMKTRTSERLLISRKDAREKLGGICTATIDKLLASGKIRACKVGRRVMISEESLREFVAGDAPTTREERC